MPRNKEIIAITGGIGAGKSEVCKILLQHGEKCISCDKINAELLLNEQYLDGLKAIFPNAVIDGKVNKQLIKEQIALHEEKRKALNRYSHEKIKAEMLSRINEEEGRVFVEVPVLNQTDYAPIFDKIWVVVSDVTLRNARIVLRDGIDEKFAEKLIEMQSTNNDYGDKTIYIINDGDKAALEKKVVDLLK